MTSQAFNEMVSFYSGKIVRARKLARRDQLLREAIRLHLEQRRPLTEFVLRHAEMVCDFLPDAYRLNVGEALGELYASIEEYIQRRYEIAPEDEELFAAALEYCRPMMKHKSSLHLPTVNCRDCFGEVVGVVLVRAIRAGAVFLA